jgi:tripartite-type tricarboxylate transporter receptor subunit TctC
MKIRQLAALCSVVAMSLFGAAAQADTFPSKPLTLLVPAPAGGVLDILARTFAKEMSASLGQQVLVDNSPGAGGTLGISKAMRAPADGYTMMMTSPVETIFGPLNYKSAQYKAEDSRPILNIGRTSVMLVTRKDLPASNLTELVALMKSRADKPLSYCSPGNGSLFHLIGEKLNATAGVKSVHVPYSGFPQCLTDLIGGNSIDFAFLPVGGPFPGAVDSGGIKAIAMLSNAPVSRFPKVVTASATKGFEDFVFSIWAGIHVNGKVPEAVAEVLNKHARATLAKPEVRADIEQRGSTLSPDRTLKQEQDDYLKEIQVYTAIFKSVGLTQQ